MRHLEQLNIEIGITQHKDYVNQLSPPETVCYVDESFDETLICAKGQK